MTNHEEISLFKRLAADLLDGWQCANCGGENGAVPDCEQCGAWLCQQCGLLNDNDKDICGCARQSFCSGTERNFEDPTMAYILLYKTRFADGSATDAMWELPQGASSSSAVRGGRGQTQHLFKSQPQAQAPQQRPNTNNQTFRGAAPTSLACDKCGVENFGQAECSSCGCVVLLLTAIWIGIFCSGYPFFVHWGFRGRNNWVNVLAKCRYAISLGRSQIARVAPRTPNPDASPRVEQPLETI